MVHYRTRQEMSATGREAQRSNFERLHHILEKTEQIKRKHIKLIDASLGLAKVRSASSEDQEYHVDLERLACDCPASDDVVCSHLRAVARACGGEDKCVLLTSLSCFSLKCGLSVRCSVFDRVFFSVRASRRWRIGERQLYKLISTAAASAEPSSETADAGIDHDAPDDNDDTARM